MHLFALLMAFNLILPATGPREAGRIPQITKTQKIIGISGFGGTYLYYPDVDKAEFLIQFTLNDVAVKFVAELDKNNKPRKLLVLGKRGTQDAKKALFEKVDEKNKEFFRYAERLVDVFVREYKVQEILKKYRKTPPPPAPKNN